MCNKSLICNYVILLYLESFLPCLYDWSQDRLRLPRGSEHLRDLLHQQIYQHLGLIWINQQS